MNIFKEMVLSIYSYKSYRSFLNNKKFKVFGFGVVLMMIYFLITMVLPFADFMFTSGGIGRAIAEYVPDFELKNGVLWVDDTFLYDYGDTYVEIDTDPDYVFYSAGEMWDFLSDYRDVIMIDSEKLILKNNGQVQEVYFDDIYFDFSRDELMRWVPYTYLIIGIFMVVAFIWMTAWFFVGALFVALIGIIVKSCMKCNLTFGQLYLMGVYSRTLPLLIKAVVSFLPFHIPFFYVINFGLSVLILGLAMQKLKEPESQPPAGFSSGAGSSMGNTGNGNDFSRMY